MFEKLKSMFWFIFSIWFFYLWTFSAQLDPLRVTRYRLSCTQYTCVCTLKTVYAYNHPGIPIQCSKLLLLKICASLPNGHRNQCFVYFISKYNTNLMRFQMRLNRIENLIVHSCCFTLENVFILRSRTFSLTKSCNLLFYKLMLFYTDRWFIKPFS